MTHSSPHPKPPGQTRPYPAPTSSGHIPFTYTPNSLSGKTAYWLWGDISKSTKTPLICLHGGPGVTHSYLLPLSLIYADYGIPVLMYDQIGCGESTAFPERKGDAAFWTPELFMAELDNVIAHFGIAEFDLLGQSWGAMLAGQYAISQPKGLRKVIIEGGPTKVAKYEAAGARLVKAMPTEAREVLEGGDCESEAYKAAEMQYYERHICRLSPWPSELVEAFGRLEADPTVYLTMMGPNELICSGNLRDWSIEDELHKITEETVPGGLLVMNGEFDSVQDEVTEAFLWRPSCRVKWIRYGLSSHLPMLEETERFTADLGKFLTQT